MNVVEWDSLSEPDRVAALRRPSAAGAADRRAQVSAIIADVRARGDAAVRDCTRRHDWVEIAELFVPEAELERAWELADEDARSALLVDAARLEAFHALQAPGVVSLETSPGVSCERRFVPLDAVGLCVSGGSISSASAVLMLAIPARLAGCRRRVLAASPGREGRLDPLLLAAAKLAGVTEVLRVGGAQAVAALAYGTETVLKVDKIFGSGDSWVAEAKRQAAADPDGAALDLPECSPEALVIADDSANPLFVAADLLAQAERGANARFLLATPSRVLLDVVRAELEALSPAQGLLVLTKDLDQALEVSERYAPERLILRTSADETLAARVRRAGAVFLGRWAPETAGGRESGLNRVLPAGGAARAFGGLGIESFMRPVSFQRLTREGLESLAPGRAISAKIHS